MIESIVTKIKNGSIALPKGLQKQWGTDEVIFVRGENGAYIQPVTPPSLSAIRPKLRKLGKLLSRKDIDNAVKWARQKTYAGRA